jgi:signal transduction histidine kinase
MRTINVVYKDKTTLLDFCNLNSIPNNEKVLLQIFTGVLDENYLGEMIRDILSLLPNINIIGSSTDGEIINDEVHNHEIVLSFSIFENTNIKIYKTEKLSSSYQTGKQLIKKIDSLENAKVAIVFADGLNTNGEVFLRAFYKYAPNLMVAGGLAGDNAKFHKTYVFTQDGIDNSSVVAAVLYNPNLIVDTSFNFGWEAIGKELTVTKSTENRVYSIDNMSPTEIYKKYLGSEIEEQLPATGIEFPLIISRNGNKVARAVVGKHEDGSLSFAGNIKKGDKVYLGYGNIDNILSNRFGFYDDFANKPIESIFVYSCMARKRLLGDEIKNEIIPMSKIAPLSGFFTYGEFYYCNASSTCSNHLFNQTMTVLTLSESVDSINVIEDNRVENQRKIQTVKALSHLISETSKELNDLNENLKGKVDEEVKKNMLHEMQILEQSKMASMGEMIANIAHQWRQPLSAISVTASSILLHNSLGMGIDTKELDEKMNLVLSRVEYLSNTIDTFRNFLKEKKEYKSVSIQDRLDMVFQIVGTSLKDNHIDLRYKSNESEPIFVSMVVGELDQIIINILNNAKDILKEKNIDNGWIDLELLTDNNRVVITVEDNGGGIPKGIISKIFEPYFTTKHQSQGTGLGLHMAYKIAKESLQGNLYVKNTNHGAKFFLEIPFQ